MTRERDPAERPKPVPGVLYDDPLVGVDLADLIDAHGPPGMGPADRERIRGLVESSTPTEMVVLAIDMRKSTFIMKEAIDPTVFATDISSFVSSAKQHVHHNGRGWFDKFTGDGFLAYWIGGVDGDGLDDALQRAVSTAASAIDAFNEVAIPRLRRNARNLPSGVGLAAGIDVGMCNLLPVAGDLTPVGAPVVGAVRMVDAARRDEIIVNIAAGERLSVLTDPGVAFDLRPESRATKEYEQAVYRVEVDPTA